MLDHVLENQMLLNLREKECLHDFVVECDFGLEVVCFFGEYFRMRFLEVSSFD